jgi:hypothetical protein
MPAAVAPSAALRIDRPRPASGRPRRPQTRRRGRLLRHDVVGRASVAAHHDAVLHVERGSRHLRRRASNGPPSAFRRAHDARLRRRSPTYSLITVFCCRSACPRDDAGHGHLSMRRIPPCNQRVSRATGSRIDGCAPPPSSFVTLSISAGVANADDAARYRAVKHHRRRPVAAMERVYPPASDGPPASATFWTRRGRRALPST